MKRIPLHVKKMKHLFILLKLFQRYGEEHTRSQTWRLGELNWGAPHKMASRIWSLVWCETDCDSKLQLNRIWKKKNDMKEKKTVAIFGWELTLPLCSLTPIVKMEKMWRVQVLLIRTIQPDTQRRVGSLNRPLTNKLLSSPQKPK